MSSVVFDFDGVIHTYTGSGKEFKPWVIEGEPIPGVKEFINRLRDHGFKVVIYSSRGSSVEGLNAMKKWLFDNSINVDGISSGKKPPGIVYLDDRAVTFDGNFTDELYDKVTNFKPYWKKE